MRFHTGGFPALVTCINFVFRNLPLIGFNMDIQHIYDGHKGMFFIKQEGHRVAEMTYVWAGTDRFIIDHTGVDEILKGKGAGKQLVANAVAFARQKGVRILPLCPFAKHVFETVPEFQDVL
jgi:uncharacterized protein